MRPSERLNRLERLLGDGDLGDGQGRAEAELRARLLERWNRLSDEEKDERLGRVARGETGLSAAAVAHARRLLGW